MKANTLYRSGAKQEGGRFRRFGQPARACANDGLSGSGFDSSPLLCLEPYTDGYRERGRETRKLALRREERLGLCLRLCVCVILESALSSECIFRGGREENKKRAIAVIRSCYLVWVFCKSQSRNSEAVIIQSEVKREHTQQQLFLWFAKTCVCVSESVSACGSGCI